MFKKILNKFEDNNWLMVSVILMAVIVLYLGTGFAMNATDDAGFCGSCHVMHEQVRTHNQSVHGDITCNQCHAPESFLKKVPFKAYAGAKDIYKNTFSEVPDVIHATELSKDVINENCLSCHAMTINNVEVNMDAKGHCVDCHMQVPHSPKIPIDERRIAGE